MDRLLLVDSDSFILLGAAGLLERTAELLGFSPAQLRRLHALPHMLRGKRMRREYPEGLREAALEATARVEGIYDRPVDDELLQRLLAVENIDDGEAALYAHLAEHRTCLLASGDLRAIRALGLAEGFRDVREAIRDRVVCLEAAVRLLVEADGVDAIATAFRPVLPYNNHLQVFFSEGNVRDQTECLAAVRSYFDELRQSYACDFLYWPPGGD